MARRKRSTTPVVTPFATGENLRWDVRWVVPKKHGPVKKWYIVVRDFGDDLQGAVELYTKVKALGRSHVTLRCKNSAFPPPEELRPRWVKKKKRVEVMRRGRKRLVLRIVDVYRNPMKRRNREGIWWCPYCREFREFVYSYELPYIHPPIPALRGFGNGRPEPSDDQLHCPMCLISTQNHHVRKWNPLAERF